MPEYKKILLDTNFLMIPGNFGLDIYEEIERICAFNYKIYILDKSLDEIKAIAQRIETKNVKRKTKARLAVKIALKLIENLGKEGKINIIPTKTDEKLKAKFAGMYVDDILKSMAEEYIIATTDMNLRKHLKRTIILRQKNHLELQDASH